MNEVNHFYNLGLFPSFKIKNSKLNIQQAARPSPHETRFRLSVPGSHQVWLLTVIKNTVP